MSDSGKYLLVGSTEAYSGKSATVLGIAFQLIDQGLKMGYGKPLGTCLSENTLDDLDEDVRLIADTLNLPPSSLRPTLLSLHSDRIAQRITGHDQQPYAQLLQQHYQPTASEDLVLLEGAGTLNEGQLFGLSMLQMAQILNGPILLVARYHSPLVVDGLLSAKERLGDRLLGVLINDISPEQMEQATGLVQPFLEQQGIPVFGLLPRSQILRSVSVGELVHHLKAEVLCCRDRLDLMVESLKIGAMNVNSALKYFRKAHNMAVVTGGDRTDLQLAALETSTHCLILTGQIPPSTTVLQRAEDLEVPILSVDLDTLTTVEIIEHTFGQVRLQEAVKVQCIRELMADHFNVTRFMAALGIEAPMPVG
ncbi:MAG: phosphotransacetylase family protein [Synechococcales bacterium]|nr:phosphotransacetylase family protein [Synechococcales bacterium]